MPPTTFLTVPTELLEYAETALKHLRDHGYKIKVEPFEVAYPARPTLLCKRKTTTLIVEVHTSVPINQLRDWTRYCASCSEDTQLALMLPDTSSISDKDMTVLRQLRIGLYKVSAQDVLELIPPIDLALNVALPQLNGLPTKVRRIVAPVYEQFDRGRWRDGFKDSCQILEDQARRYLKKGLHSTRIVVLDKNGRPKPLRDSQIEKMTHGALAETFTRIQTPNHADSVIAKSLKTVLPDRNKQIHHPGKGKNESTLRTNVGTHMWTIVNALKELLK